MRTKPPNERRDPSDRDDPNNYDQYGNRILDEARIKEVRAQIEFLTGGSSNAARSPSPASSGPQLTPEERRGEMEGMARMSRRNHQARVDAQEQRKLNWERNAPKRRDEDERAFQHWVQLKAAYTGRLLISGLLAVAAFVLSAFVYSESNQLPSVGLFLVSAFFGWRFATAKSPGKPPPQSSG